MGTGDTERRYSAQMDFWTLIQTGISAVQAHVQMSGRTDGFWTCRVCTVHFWCLGSDLVIWKVCHGSYRYLCRGGSRLPTLSPSSWQGTLFKRLKSMYRFCVKLWRVPAFGVISAAWCLMAGVQQDFTQLGSNWGSNQRSLTTPGLQSWSPKEFTSHIL